MPLSPTEVVVELPGDEPNFGEDDTVDDFARGTGMESFPASGALLETVLD